MESDSYERVKTQLHEQTREGSEKNQNGESSVLPFLHPQCVETKYLRRRSNLFSAGTLRALSLSLSLSLPIPLPFVTRRLLSIDTLFFSPRPVTFSRIDLAYHIPLIIRRVYVPWVTSIVTPPFFLPFRR